MLCNQLTGLAVITEGKLGFLPNTNWFGLNPRLLCKAFFALTAHTRAFSTEHPLLSTIFKIIFLITALCRSTTPFNHGDSAAVVYTFVPSNSATSCRSSLLNSPPLSDRMEVGVPNVATQCLRITSTMTSLCLELMTDAELNF